MCRLDGRGLAKYLSEHVFTRFCSLGAEWAKPCAGPNEYCNLANGSREKWGRQKREKEKERKNEILLNEFVDDSFAYGLIRIDYNSTTYQAEQFLHNWERRAQCPPF